MRSPVIALVIDDQQDGDFVYRVGPPDNLWTATGDKTVDCIFISHHVTIRFFETAR